MRFIFFLLSLLFVHPACVAQGEIEADENHWTRRTPAFRVGGGRQPAYFVETGVSVHRNTMNAVRKNSDCFYGALELSGAHFEDRGFLITGIKAGYERSWRGLLVGLEGKRQSGARPKDWVLTPRAGVTLHGLLSLTYGLNISANGYPIPRHGPH